jgi:hypothetical protein
MKFCCYGFESHYKVRNGLSPNIRIVKITSDFLVNQDNPSKRKKFELKYFIVTMCYDVFSYNLPLMNINFCPYCGKNLHYFYDKEEYANEVEGETFQLL